MKIDSVKNFGHALFHPFDNKIKITTLQRVALVFFSGLLFVPLVFAGVSALIHRISKKSHNDDSTTAKTHAKAQEILRSANPGEGLRRLRAEKGDSEFLKALSRVQTDAPQDHVIPLYIEIACTCPSNEQVVECLDGLMRFTTSSYANVCFALRKIATERTETHPLDQRAIAKIQRCFEAMSPTNTPENASIMENLVYLGISSAPNELRLWAIDELMRIYPIIKSEPRLGLDIDLLEDMQCMATSSKNRNDEICIKAIRCLISLYTTRIQESSSDEQMIDRKECFHTVLRNVVEEHFIVKSMGSNPPGGSAVRFALMEELLKLRHNYPNWTLNLIRVLFANLIAPLEEHPHLREAALNELIKLHGFIKAAEVRQVLLEEIGKHQKGTTDLIQLFSEK